MPEKISSSFVWRRRLGFGMMLAGRGDRLGRPNAVYGLVMMMIELSVELLRFHKFSVLANEEFEAGDPSTATHQNLDKTLQRRIFVTFSFSNLQGYWIML